MENVAFFDTSIYTYNIGDQIIMESVRAELENLTEGSFLLSVPTHTPIFHLYEAILDKVFKKKYNRINRAKIKFVGGTNLISGNMFHPKNNWNINLLDSFFINGCILVGAGHNSEYKKVNWYTKKTLKNVLSSEYIHSVRDESTKQLLETIGIEAINTGCCTLWKLNEEHCKNISRKKSENVVFTLTDYKRDFEKDRELIEILKKNYVNVYFWIQGMEDYDYFNMFDNIQNIKIINPSLKAYDEFLRDTDCDFIGTRLHGGIRALQKGKRTIIINIDNRARNMGKDYNLKCVERDNLKELEKLINSEFETKVKLAYDEIEKWKKQFCR